MNQTVRLWQVWWADLDPSEDSDQAWQRPVVVISSSFHLRLTGGRLVTVIPLTTTDRGLPTQPKVRVGRRVSVAMTEQVRTMAVTRLNKQIGRLSSEEIAAVRGIVGQMILD